MSMDWYPWHGLNECDLISPFVKLYTLLTVIRLRGRPCMAANVTGSSPAHRRSRRGTSFGFSASFTTYADSFSLFFLFGLVVFGCGEICLARFKLTLRYFAKFRRREMSSVVFPVKSRLCGLALTGSGLVCRTLQWQNENPQINKKQKKPENN